MSAIDHQLNDTAQYAPLQGSRNAEPTDFDALNELLRGELSAVEAYDQAIGKFRNHLGIDEIKIIRDEHAASAALLRDRILAHGGIPSATSGTWGAFVGGVTSVAKVFGPKALIAALLQGEEHGVRGYRQAMDSERLALECRELIAEDLLPRCRLHVGELQELGEMIDH